MAIPVGAGADPTEAGPCWAIAKPDSMPPYVQVYGNIPGATSVTIYRNEPDGTMTPVRNGHAIVATGPKGSVAIVDVESPFGVPLTYTAVGNNAVTGTSPGIILISAVAWLRHLFNPNLSLALTIQNISALIQPVIQSVLVILGRNTPVVVSDGSRKAFQGTLSLYLDTLAERYGLISVTADNTPLLLDCPPQWNFDLTHEYLSLGQAAWVTPGPGNQPFRTVDLPFYVVDSPPALEPSIVLTGGNGGGGGTGGGGGGTGGTGTGGGGTPVPRTYAVLDGTKTTYTALDALYASYATMLSGVVVG